MDARLQIFHCVVPADVVARRLKDGLADPKNVRVERHPEKSACIPGEFEPIDLPHVTVDTSGLPDTVLRDGFSLPDDLLSTSPPPNSHGAGAANATD